MTMSRRMMYAVLIALLTLTVGAAGASCVPIQKHACSCGMDEGHCTCCKIRPSAPRENGLPTAPSAPDLLAGSWENAAPSIFLADSGCFPVFSAADLGGLSPPIYLKDAELRI
jgi:hypothetical protein